jgi:hypothetical protein
MRRTAGATPTQTDARSISTKRTDANGRTRTLKYVAPPYIVLAVGTSLVGPELRNNPSHPNHWKIMRDHGWLLTFPLARAKVNRSPTNRRERALNVDNARTQKSESWLLA